MIQMIPTRNSSQPLNANMRCYVRTKVLHERASKNTDFAKSQRPAIGRAVIALGAVAIIVVAAVAYFSLTSPGGSTATQTPTPSTGASHSATQSATQSTCTVPSSGNVTVTVTAGQFPPCGCSLVDSNSNGSLYVSTSAKVGDNVCITASLNNSPQVNLSVKNSIGVVLFSGTCVASQPPGASPPTGDTCTAYWNTANPDPRGNPIEPGTYLLVASDYQSSPAVLEANLTLSGFITGTSVNSSSNTYFSSTCVISGVGGFSLRVVSDSTGSPVSGEKVNAIDHLGCGSTSQVVYLDNFSVGKGGWLTPVFPNQATPAGQLNFMVAYQGKMYNFTTSIAPIGSACVTLHVPSGNVTTTTTMNEPCS
jgi:hypothetical protein